MILTNNQTNLKPKKRNVFFGLSNQSIAFLLIIAILLISIKITWTEKDLGGHLIVESCDYVGLMVRGIPDLHLTFLAYNCRII